MIIGMDVQPAGIKDSLEYSLHYGELCLRVARLFKSDNYETMEKCAEIIAYFLLTEYDDVEDVNVRIRKTSSRIEEKTSEISVEIHRMKNRVFISLCDYSGDDKYINQMNSKIEYNENLEIINSSHIIDSIDEDDGREFKCQVIELLSILKPVEFNTYLLKSKEELGLEDSDNSDLKADILFFNDLIYKRENLIIPNPYVEERMHILEGITDIAPFYIHPVLNRQIRHLKNLLELEMNLLSE